MMIYDPQTDSWADAPIQVPTRREFDSYSCTAFLGRLFIIGGEGRVCEPISTVDVFDPQTESWVVVPPLPHPRAFHTCSVQGNQLSVVSSNAEWCARTRREIPESELLFDGLSSKWNVGDVQLVTAPDTKTRIQCQYLEPASPSWEPRSGTPAECDK